MVKKFIGLMIATLLIFSLAACNQSKEIPFEISNKTTNYFDTDEREALLQIVNSLDELTQLMREKEFDISPIYEEDFFENKVLILYFFIESTDVQFEIKLEKVDSDTLKVEKVYDLGDGTLNTITVPYAFIIEVRKDDIAEISNIKSEENMEIKAGFERKATSEPVPGVFCAYIVEKSDAQVGEDVEVLLFYGLVGDYGDPSEANVTAKIAVRNNSESKVLLKTVENFTIENYKCDMKSDNWLVGFSVEFSHSETFVVPSELFDGGNGYLVFQIQVYIHLFQQSQDVEPNEGTEIALYYKVDDGKVFLSATKL